MRRRFLARKRVVLRDPPKKKRATKTHCRKGHPYTFDAKGHPRCKTCDRERYRKKHPFHAPHLEAAGLLAPWLRSQKASRVDRKVAITNKAGEVIGYTTIGKMQDAMLAKHGMPFEVGLGHRPSHMPCMNCGRVFKVPSQGPVALTCPRGCAEHPECHVCHKPMTVKSARMFARQRRKPICRHCADLARPKVDECKRGHAFTPENTLYSAKTNQRFCRACKRERMRQSRARKK